MNERQSEVLLEYRNQELDAKLVIDDDGKVAYAYLIVEDSIVSDVWLYNVGDPPEGPEWPDPEKMPFSNPAEFVSNEMFAPLAGADEISLSWESRSAHVQQVTITLRGQVHAILRPGSKPGWCRLSAKASPIGRPIDEID